MTVALSIAEQRRMIAKLRCLACSRAPTAPEQQEMLENFGHKLDKRDDRKLVWRCGACRKKEVS